MDYTVDSMKKYISPPFRGGGVVEFNAARFKAVTGTLFFVQGGRKSPAEYAGLEVTVGGRTITAVVGLWEGRSTWRTCREGRITRGSSPRRRRPGSTAVPIARKPWSTRERSTPPCNDREHPRRRRGDDFC